MTSFPSENQNDRIFLKKDLYQWRGNRSIASRVRLFQRNTPYKQRRIVRLQEGQLSGSVMIPQEKASAHPALSGSMMDASERLITE